MFVFSQQLCGVEKGGVIAYELITKFYLMLFTVTMILLNSNYIFTQYYVPISTILTTYFTVAPHYGFTSHATVAMTSDVFYFVIFFMVANNRYFGRSVELFIAQYEQKNERE